MSELAGRLLRRGLLDEALAPKKNARQTRIASGLFKGFFEGFLGVA